MTNSVAGLVLLVVSISAFNNYQRGTLRQWFGSKFLNISAPAQPGQQLIGLGLAGLIGGNTLKKGSDAIAAGIDEAMAIGTLKLETWRGTQLNASAMGSWKQLVLAAEADGVSIGGDGYRSNARQKALRAAHGCGGAKLMDHGCKGTPPTAVPGTSQHEVGLAVDVRNCKTHATKAYQWLAANAPQRGWKNLPSEPWHWSTGPKAGS